MNKRLYIKKRKDYQVEKETLQNDLISSLHLPETFSMDLYNIYDVYDIEPEALELLKSQILSDPVTDEILEDIGLEGKEVLAYEFLPGQYDQRANSAIQCLGLLEESNARIHSGTLLVMDAVDEADKEKIITYLVNPVESRIKDLSVMDDSIDLDVQPVSSISGFIEMDKDALKALHEAMGLAMSMEDLAFIQSYFQKEGRDPLETEIRVLDTYWSDHCRHTTFETRLEDIAFDSRYAESMKKAYTDYLGLKEETGRSEKPRTLMEMATIAARALKKRGKLEDLEQSDEINACSVEIPVDVNGEQQDWLLMFKNETHNHPTEIEPFGGASTCLGGAIRDPLSGRSYVYQAMRITGAGDINKPVEETLEHKLPQSKISKSAAAGYSSYGNQIGLATTFVQELFDEDYTAKRMEVGVVVGAAPKENVKREKPEAGDLIVLVGGATGRDGIGGATGSSKEHTETSLEKCSSEVQKGNALIERKLQRFFRNPEVSKLIKKANDFGAGGVSVAVGELADGLDIDLNAVPIKYEGLDGTELAISESQERMAVTIAKEDLELFKKLAEEENLQAYVIAVVDDTNRLKMKWNDQIVVDLDRDFLNTNGVLNAVDVKLSDSSAGDPFVENKETLCQKLAAPNSASQIGLAEMFDASIGKSTVLMPFGGKTQRTPEQGSVQKLPVFGKTDTCSVLAFGFDPSISKYSPYLGAQYSVVEALSKLSALGADPLSARLTNQEYFKRLKTESDWGLPFQALLGLMKAEMAFEVPSIGGKDSMSGTFKNLHVPPTLITFAITTAKTDQIKSSVLKKAGNALYLIKHDPIDQEPNYAQLIGNYKSVLENADCIVSSRAVLLEGISPALAKMAFGNGLGVDVNYKGIDAFNVGSILVEVNEKPAVLPENWIEIGSVTETADLVINGVSTSLEEVFAAWTGTFDGIYPRHSKEKELEIDFAPADVELAKGEKEYSKVQVETPKVLIPVFPGQNCEYDLKAKFERAGGDVTIQVFNNQSPAQIEKSIDDLAAAIKESQILMLAGGFSLADEPDGSGKFISSVLKNEKVANAIREFREADGLILGICNGFQALIKSGLLLDNAETMGEGEPTLFRNDLNRHISHIVNTRVSSNRSPWLQDYNPGDVHAIAISHGEGKLVASPEWLKKLAENGQIATQYVDENGNPTMNPEFNVNGSNLAIEGILSKDGRVFGKMGHNERYEEGLMLNIDGDKDQDIFASGIRFFTHEGKEKGELNG